MSYWVTTSGPSSVAASPGPSPFLPASRLPFLPPFDGVQIGTYSSSGPGAITTPAAWTDACRESPSSVIE